MLLGLIFLGKFCFADIYSNASGQLSISDLSIPFSLFSIHKLVWN